MNKLINTSYASNFSFWHALIAVGVMLSPWQWYKDWHQIEVRNWFGNWFETDSHNIFLFNHARSAIFALLDALPLSENDEIVYVGFTCIAAVNPAIWCGLKPVFADVNAETLTADFEAIKKVVTEQTKVIVVQHTFGKVVEINELMIFAKSKGIFVIEDCAQLFGGQYLDGPKVGLKSDASIFSFGREKMLSSVDGGVLILNNTFYLEALESGYDQLEAPSLLFSLKRLVYIPAWLLIRFFMIIPKLGKGIHFLFTKLGILARATTDAEKKRKMPKGLIAKMPESLAIIALSQLKDLEQILATHKRNYDKFASKFAELGLDFIKYSENEIPLRFTLLIDDTATLRNEALLKNIQLGDWYDQPIGPKGVNMDGLYESGTCKVAESCCERVVNLPLHSGIGDKEIGRIVELFEKAKINEIANV